MYYCADHSNVHEDVRSSPRYTFIEGNITNKELVKFVLKQNHIDHVIHFAAQSHVQNSFNNSLQYAQDNIIGTHVLLECCREHGVEKFVHVSTDEVYGESMNDAQEKARDEQSFLCPTNPYAATKAGAELIARSYWHSFNMLIIITRENNVYGPRQYPEKLIPKFIKQLRHDKKVTIHGDGSALRAFMHVDDAVRAFDVILRKGKNGEIYNIGCDEGMEYSVMHIAKILIRLIKNTDYHSDWIEYIDDRPFNDKRYYISNHKLRSLGWTQKIPFEKGIESLLKDE